MAHEKVYAICEDDSFVETMTKEQIQNASVKNAKQIAEYNHDTKLKFWLGTRAEYDALEYKLSYCIYIISDEIEQNKLLYSGTAETIVGKTIENLTKYSIIRIKFKRYGTDVPVSAICSVIPTWDHHTSLNIYRINGSAFVPEFRSPLEYPISYMISLDVDNDNNVTSVTGMKTYGDESSGSNNNIKYADVNDFVILEIVGLM